LRKINETEHVREYRVRTEMLEVTRLMSHGKDRIGVVRLAALVAALVFALQSAFAVAATPVQRDIFGNVICTEGGGGQMPAGGGHDGGHMPDCCMLSCGSAFQTAQDVPAAIEWPAVVFAGEAITYPSPVAVSRHHKRTPANPRAPPAAA
jgi:hypothetical protein